MIKWKFYQAVYWRNSLYSCLQIINAITSSMCKANSDRRLRSSTRGNFIVRQTKTRLADSSFTVVADSSFTVAGPAAWNSLPVHIRNIQSHSAFCRHLKTYLFADWFNFNIYFILWTYFNYVLILINYFVRRCWAPVEQRHSKSVMMIMMKKADLDESSECSAECLVDKAELKPRLLYTPQFTHITTKLYKTHSNFH